MFAFIRSILSGNGLLLALVAALASTGWLLFQAHQSIGAAESEIEQWKQANQHWADAWQKRETEITQAQDRLAKREQDYTEIQGALDEYRKKLREITAVDSDLDCGVRPSVWMLIKESATHHTRDGTVPSD